MTTAVVVLPTPLTRAAAPAVIVSRSWWETWETLSPAVKARMEARGLVIFA